MEYVVEKFYNGMHFITLDPTTAAALTENGNKRAICTLNNEVQIHCAIMHQKLGGHYVCFGMATCKKLHIKAGDRVVAGFAVDTTQYQFEMPEELKEILDTDPEASEIFHSLTSGNQRGLLYLVAHVKTSDKKIERALKIADRIKNGITSPRLVMEKYQSYLSKK